jgi:Glutamine synthetase adenylyltransferase
LSALCDLGGVWALSEVTGALSLLADRATHVALRAHVAREISRGKIPGQTEADIESCGGMFALAMGKHGAGELNYSSDIDLICLFDEERFDGIDQMEARAGFIRATRRAMAALSDLTSEGYVFRTDLRLRPDPSVTPVCFAMEAAERYYESVGRTWERAAYIKARVCAGDQDAGARFLQAMTPFVWRRHLDFNAIRETHDMRLKIRAHKGLGGALKLEGHNMKLGFGGIREIEFFAQTRQLIAGGAIPICGCGVRFRRWRSWRKRAGSSARWPINSAGITWRIVRSSTGSRCCVTSKPTACPTPPRNSTGSPPSWGRRSRRCAQRLRNAANGSMR